MRIFNTLLCLTAATLAFIAALKLIITDSKFAVPPATAVRATAAANPSSPFTAAVRVRLLLVAADRVPAQAEDQVWDLDPHTGDQPLTWRALLTPQRVHHV